MSTSSLSVKDELVQEYLRCGKDPSYFIKKYIKIPDPVNGGSMLFNTYPYQDKCLEDFKKNRFNICVKSRQLGLTTLVAAYSLWLTYFHKNLPIAVIATNLATAKQFTDKVKFMYKNLPGWFKLTSLTSETKTEMYFKNGSNIKAVPTGPHALRGWSGKLLVVDEAAFIKDFDELFTGLFPTVSTGGNMIVISSPSNAGGQFYDLWCGALTHQNDFNPIELKWDVEPTRGEKWYKTQTTMLSERQFQQEYCCSFAASGDTFIQGDDISYIENCVKVPIDRQHTDGNFWIWEYVQPNCKYVIGADVSRGNSDDYSTAVVLNVNTRTVVAEYKGKQPPDRFGEMLAVFGKYYNNAVVCPENNSYGNTCLMRLKQLAYPNLFWEKGKEFLPFGGVYTPASDKEEPGFATHAKNRLVVLNQLEEAIRNKRINILSQRFVLEAKTFIWKDSGRPEASKGKNDDLIMAYAICLYVGGYTGEHDEGAKNLANTLLKGFELFSPTRQDPSKLVGIKSNPFYGGLYVPDEQNINPYKVSTEEAPTEKEAYKAYLRKFGLLD